MEGSNLIRVLKKIEERAGRQYPSQTAIDARKALASIISQTTDPLQAEIMIYQTLQRAANNISPHSTPRTVVEVIDVRELSLKSLKRARDEYGSQFSQGTLTPRQAEKIVSDAYVHGKFKDTLDTSTLGYARSGNPLGTNTLGSGDPANRSNRVGWEMT